MSKRVISNRYKSGASLLVTANATINVAGNSTSSDIAVQDEVLTGGYISAVIFGGPYANDVFWTVKRGANTVAVLAGTGSISYRELGEGLRIDEAAPINITLNGSTEATLLIRIQKVVDGRSGLIDSTYGLITE